MQAKRKVHSSAKRSAKRMELPSGSSTRRYEAHASSANSGNVAVSNGSPYWNDAAWKLARHSAACSFATINAAMLSSFGEVSTIAPGVLAVLPGLRTTICKCDLLSRHFPKIKNASEDEMLVMQFFLSFGAKEASALASKLHLKFRPAILGAARRINITPQNLSQARRIDKASERENKKL
jgi:hypothetical protein